MPRLAQTRGRCLPHRLRPLRLRPARVVRRLATASVLVLILAGLAATQPAGAQGTSNWPSYLFNSGHSSYNPAATSITTGNVANLQPVWQFFQSTPGNRQFYASPTVYDGVVYIGSLNGYFYAISEATQQVLWSQDFGVTPAARCASDGISATAEVVDDSTTGLTVYVNAPNGQLYALSASTGAILWHATVDTPSTTEDNYYSWSSPLVANGNVYVGVSSQCSAPFVPAGVEEYNQGTGALEDYWHSLPNNELGASVWSSVAESTLGDGSIFVTTGDAATSSQPAYAESIVRLSGTDLSLLDSWQVPVGQQTADGDFGASPTMFTADLDGTTTQMVGACNKNGIYYALAQDDLHAGPVWEFRIADAYQNGQLGECDSAAIWNGTDLIEGGGNTTVIKGVTYQGSVRALNPATGAPVWQTGLPGEVIGSPTEDGAGVVAAQVFDSTTGNLGVYLLRAGNGAILDYINLNPSPLFAQPVFAGDDLLVAGDFAVGLISYEITTPGPAITAVTPSTLGQGGSRTVTLTGSGFSGTPSVFVSGTLVTASSVVVKSPTSLQMNLTAGNIAPTGARNITVIEPGNVADTCSGCLTVDPRPVISNLNPNSIPNGATTTVVISGSNFVSGLRVTTTIPGASVGTPTNVTSTSFSVAVTVPSGTAAGSYSLSVRNPDDGSGSATITVT
jgi:outer membrane protein assembly factor BamB